MQWCDAIKMIAEQRIKEMEEKGLRRTNIAEEFLGKRNFFTRLFQGKVQRLDLDKELEPLAKALGFTDVVDLLAHAQEKKTA